jgi:hypothetical protein
MEALWQTFLTAILSGIAGWLVASLRALTESQRQKEQESDQQLRALEDGVRALLHDRLFSFYTQYESAESIPSKTWSEIEQMYHAYHALGGNGTGTRLYELLEKKPLQSDDR